MSEQPNPDYVDRCIDFISNRRQRCFADLALCAIIVGALLVLSPNEYNNGAGSSAWSGRYGDFVEADRRCETLDESPNALDWSGDLTHCLKS